MGYKASRRPELAERTISKYGCAGCHQIKGHEDDPKIGADLNEYGRKTVDLLDFNILAQNFGLSVGPSVFSATKIGGASAKPSHAIDSLRGDVLA